MSEFQYDRNYVETKHGKIHVHDIPYVVEEPFGNKLAKACLFYSVFIVAFFVIICVVIFHRRANENDRIVKKIQLKNMAAPGFKKVRTFINMSKIRIFNFTNSLPIEHIVLVNIDNNVIDIDVEYNYFIKKHKIGRENRGDLFEVDLGTSKAIKEIILLVDPDRLFASDSELLITLELYDFANKVWEHSDTINQRENSIKIFKEIVGAEANASQGQSCLYEPRTKKEVLIFNEDSLAIRLREFDESYDRY